MKNRTWGPDSPLLFVFHALGCFGAMDQIGDISGGAPSGGCSMGAFNQLEAQVVVWKVHLYL